MKQWERMEEYLYSADLAGTKAFTNHDVAHFFGITPSEGSHLISAYLDAMKKPNCNTLYAIRRENRTTATVWHIGHSAKDARALTAQFADDVEHRVTDVIAPMVQHITTLNPKAQPQATKTMIRIGRLIQTLAELVK